MRQINNFDQLMDCCPSNRENFLALTRFMRRNVVIPFLGAGFSANYGYKTWRGFLEDQIRANNLLEINDMPENGRYEKAASELKNQMGMRMEYALVQNFGDHIYKVSGSNEELEEIPKMFQNLILTTNFDEVIEMLYAKVNGEYIEKLTPKSLNDIRVSYKRIACGEPTLIKLHGDVAMKEFVLTEEEYDEIYGKRVLDIRLPLPSFLRDVLLSKIILFMGCSLEEDRTLKVIEQAQIDGSISFAFLPLPCETENKCNPWNPVLFDREGDVEKEKIGFAQRKQFLNEYNIIPIWYPYQKHEALKVFVKALSFYSHSEQNLSVTVVCNTFERLVYEGDIFKENGNVSQAFYSYAKAEELIRRNPESFSKENRLQQLEKIKNFYDRNGYIYECKEIRKEILEQTAQTFQSDSIEMAMCYHDIGYAYERFRYYKLMFSAMEQSWKILQKSKKESEETIKYLNACAFIYISLGYAHLKNNRKEEAKEWYKKAKELYEQNGSRLDKNEKSFLCNGLYRYYDLLGESTKALRTLEAALSLRKELFYEDKIGSANHLVNTYSNMIRIFLKRGEIKEAKIKYDAYLAEPGIWNRLEDHPDAKCRILTDYGDILHALKDKEAYKAYQEAIQYRKYLHFPNDTIIAELYRKMADCLKDEEDVKCREKAMCYLIQSYVIYERLLRENFQMTTEIMKEIEKLGETLSYDGKIVELRVSIQKELLNFNYDERMNEREGELIQFFELQ